MHLGNVEKMTLNPFRNHQSHLYRKDFVGVEEAGGNNVMQLLNLLSVGPCLDFCISDQQQTSF